MSPTWRIAASWWAGTALGSPPAMPATSAPEQNSPPAPVITTARSVRRCGDRAQFGQELVPHLAVDGVLPLGTPKRDRHDAVRPCHRDRFEIPGLGVAGFWTFQAFRRSCSATILTRMGFNPYRKFRAKPADYALVAIAIVVAVGLVVWAFAG